MKGLVREELEKRAAFGQMQAEMQRDLQVRDLKHELQQERTERKAFQERLAMQQQIQDLARKSTVQRELDVMRHELEQSKLQQALELERKARSALEERLGMQQQISQLAQRFAATPVASHLGQRNLVSLDQPTLPVLLPSPVDSSSRLQAAKAESALFEAEQQMEAKKAAMQPPIASH